jgi:hypothetical protein
MRRLRKADAAACSEARHATNDHHLPGAHRHVHHRAALGGAGTEALVLGVAVERTIGLSLVAVVIVLTCMFCVGINFRNPPPTSQDHPPGWHYRTNTSSSIPPTSKAQVQDP